MCLMSVSPRAGSTVWYVLMDGEFEKVKNELTFIVYNTTATKELVAEAESQIRVLKERYRGILYIVAYKYVPWRMKIEILYFIVL